MDYAKRFKKECLILKIEFENSYDIVSWSYLISVMKLMWFRDRWRKWMREYDFFSIFFVLVNGTTSLDFKVIRGLKQRDRLSPFVFFLGGGRSNRADE